MSEFYIASFSLNSNDLCHSGRKGMKWYQHIFGKEPSSKRTAKQRRAKQKAALKQANKINKTYLNEDWKTRNYQTYLKDIANVMKNNVSDPRLIKELADATKKNEKVLEKHEKINQKFYEYEGKDNTKAMKYDKMYSDMFKDVFKAGNEHGEKVNAVIKDIFGTYYNTSLTNDIDHSYYKSGFGYISSLDSDILNKTLKEIEKEVK
jgi:hypothetical protein